MSLKEKQRASATKWFLGKIERIDSEADRAKFEGLLAWARKNGVDRDIITAQAAAAEARISENDGERNCLEVEARL